MDASHFFRRRRRGSFSTAIATQLIGKIFRADTRGFPTLWARKGDGRLPVPRWQYPALHWLSLCSLLSNLVTITQSTYSSLPLSSSPTVRDQSLNSRLIGLLKISYYRAFTYRKRYSVHLYRGSTTENPKSFQHKCRKWLLIAIFTARCTLVQSAVLRSHVVCLSVRLSVCLSVCNVGELWSHRLEFFKNNFTIS